MPEKLIDVLKTNSGSVKGLATSKKYGLVAAITSKKYGLVAAITSILLAVVGTTVSEKIQIVSLICATATVIAYVIGQSWAEASGVKYLEPQDTSPTAAGSVSSPTGAPTTTTGPTTQP